MKIDYTLYVVFLCARLGPCITNRVCLIIRTDVSSTTTACHRPLWAVIMIFIIFPIVMHYTLQLVEIFIRFLFQISFFPLWTRVSAYSAYYIVLLFRLFSLMSRAWDEIEFPINYNSLFLHRYNQMRMIYNFFFRPHNSLLCSTAYNVIKTVERSFGVFIYDLI